MKLFYKLFAFSLALLSIWSIKAKRIEVILHDDGIKLFLANQGLDLDTAWKNCFNQPGRLFDNSDLDINALYSKIKKIQEKSADTSFDFPETIEDFNTILNQLGFCWESDGDSHQENEKNFNTLLADENNRFEHTIKQLTSNNLRNGIIKAISSYFYQRAVSARLEKDNDLTKQQIHLYIKFVIDTDEQTITLQTCPYSSQTGFVKNYTNKYIKDLIAAKVSTQPTACSKFCCNIKRVIIGTGVILALITVVGALIDPETLEELAKRIEESQ